jgi:hypothetical protein
VEPFVSAPTPPGHIIAQSEFKRKSEQVTVLHGNGPPPRPVLRGRCQPGSRGRLPAVASGGRCGCKGEARESTEQEKPSGYGAEASAEACARIRSKAQRSTGTVCTKTRKIGIMGS